MTFKNNYECMFIIQPNLSKDDTDKLIEKFQALLVSLGAEMARTDKMGKRKLAYEVRGQQEGFYCLFQFKAEGSAMAELERQLRLSDPVIKFLIFKTDPMAAVVPLGKPASRPSFETHAPRPAPAPVAPAAPAAVPVAVPVAVPEPPKA
jgi:small subunit ribosomal protein S6